MKVEIIGVVLGALLTSFGKVVNFIFNIINEKYIGDIQVSIERCMDKDFIDIKNISDKPIYIYSVWEGGKDYIEGKYEYYPKYIDHKNLNIIPPQCKETIFLTKVNQLLYFSYLKPEKGIIKTTTIRIEKIQDIWSTLISSKSKITFITFEKVKIFLKKYF